MLWSIFLIGLIFLIYFSYIDIKTHRLANKPIVRFLLIGLVLNFLTGKILIGLTATFLMFIFGYSLWRFANLGGADAKLLVSLTAFLDPSSVTDIIPFMILLGILTVSMTLLINLSKKKVKQIPFIPIITLTYVIFWILKPIFSFF